MITSLKPYPIMKDSGVPWLGEVPENWEVNKVKNLARPGHKTFIDGDWIESPYITDDGVRLIQTGNIGVGAYREKGFRYISDSTFDALNCTEFQPGDVLVCRLGEPVGRACRAPDLGIRMITSVDVCILKTREDVDSTFVVYVMSSRRYLDWVNSLVRGSTRDRVSRSMLGRFVIPQPPPPEQAAIVRLLDFADRRIRRYIRAKQKLIKLLEEYKQAIIHRAVTGQIDVRTGKPYPAYKSSGVEWLGDVPEHWETRKLGQCGSIAGGMTPSMEVRRYWDGDIPWVTPKDMKTLAIGDSIVRVSRAAVDETSLQTIDSRAVLLVVRGMILARKVPIAWTAKPITINQDMKAIRPSQAVDAKYLAMTLDSAQDAFVPLIDEAGHGTKRLPTERWRNMVVGMPPLSEQVAIVEYLDQVTADIDTTIARAMREIALLREYRTRLIADVVTGKLDVREAAANLPDEAEEPKAPDDTLLTDEDTPEEPELEAEVA